jgi:hypothetical protein
MAPERMTTLANLRCALLGLLLLCFGAPTVARAGDGPSQLVTLALGQVAEAAQPATLKATLTNVSKGDITIAVMSPLLVIR